MLNASYGLFQSAISYTKWECRRHGIGRVIFSTLSWLAEERCLRQFYGSVSGDQSFWSLVLVQALQRGVIVYGSALRIAPSRMWQDFEGRWSIASWSSGVQVCSDFQ
jgi:hypothetical protein